MNIMEKEINNLNHLKTLIFFLGIFLHLCGWFISTNLNDAYAEEQYSVFRCDPYEHDVNIHRDYDDCDSSALNDYDDTFFVCGVMIILMLYLGTANSDYDKNPGSIFDKITYTTKLSSRFSWKFIAPYTLIALIGLVFLINYDGEVTKILENIESKQYSDAELERELSFDKADYSYFILFFGLSAIFSVLMYFFMLIDYEINIEENKNKNDLQETEDSDSIIQEIEHQRRIWNIKSKTFRASSLNKDQINIKNKYKSKKERIGSYENWKKDNEDGNFEDYKRFFESE